MDSRHYNAAVRILISAGEASGEMYGAQLMEALRSELRCVGDDSSGSPDSGHVGMDDLARSAERSSAIPEPHFFGVGGTRMRDGGCDIVVDAQELSVVGITEIVGHLPKIWRLFHHLIDEADRRKPDLAIVIDSPAFNWRVAQQMKKRGVPVVYYVCPQFWAWRQGRVRLLRKYVDKALVIFPFEEKFYRDRGVNAEFVGHPLADLARPAVTREEYAAQHGLVSSKPWITLMPGSRVKEVRMNLPEILRAADLLGSELEFIIPVAPTISKSVITQLMQARHTVVPIHLVPDSLPALDHSRAGIIASGTATVEAAIMGLPFVMVYRVSPLTYLLGRWAVKVPHFAMVNLIAGEPVVPELVQHDFTAEKVVSEMREIIAESSRREKMIEELRRVKQSLVGAQDTNLHSVQRAAKAILQVVAGPPIV